MTREHSSQEPHLTCAECRSRLQQYADGDLLKPASMQVFLHLRDCTDCAAELARVEHLFAMLGDLPDHEPAADFDDRVLASVPYESYRAMAGIRQPRVPVLLTEEALPAWVRTRGVRLSGAGAAAVAVAARIAGLVPDAALFVAVAGLLPEAVVALQWAARRVVLAVAAAGKDA
jgi:anti-sigma factor RsiW